MWNFVRNLPETGRVLSRVARPSVQETGNSQRQPVRAFYDLLQAYYDQNGLYDGITSSFARAGLWQESFKEFRNPAHRVVEFYAAKLWPGDLPRALPIATDNDELRSAIAQIWTWSNWATEKQLAARWFALFGDMFIKVAETDTGTPESERKVFLQVLDPRHVTDFTVDSRGYLTMIRIDIPQHVTVQDGRKVRVQRELLTEVWTKTRVMVYRSTESPDTGLDKLGRPERDDENPLGFVPVAYTPLLKVSRERGYGAFAHAITKIDEASRMATRLHQIVFRHSRVIWALAANGTDGSGRPLPAPSLGIPGHASTTGDNPDTIMLGDDEVIGLPGNSTLTSLVPNIPYSQMLQILEAHLEELRNDLPELRYFDLSTRSGQSGVALSILIADAIDRVVEARGQGEACLVRAHQMALTIAQRAQRDGFAAKHIGTYEQGDFAHSIASRPVIPLTMTERFDIITKGVAVNLPIDWLMRQVGWSSEDVRDMESARDAQREQAKTAQSAAQKTDMAAADAVIARSEALITRELALEKARSDQQIAQDVQRQEALARSQQSLQQASAPIEPPAAGIANAPGI